MRLLICTQVMDRNHPGLGFFHRWVEVLAEHFERIEVVCLEQGVVTLPDTVRVHSLGKEKGRESKMVYRRRFAAIMRDLDDSYDAVFVHMNPEYVFLGLPWWRAKRVPVALWYNHQHGGWKLALASLFVTHLLHTSPYAATAKYRKARRMPTGIDTDTFKPTGTSPVPHSIYFQGRVSPAKRIDVLLGAFSLLRERVSDARLDIVGPEQEPYTSELKTRFNGLVDSGVAVFRGPLPNEVTPEQYASHAVSVNLTAAGNFDKSVLESLACSTPAVVSGEGFRGIVPDTHFFKEGDITSLVDTLERVLTLSESERARLAEEAAAVVRTDHSLTKLVDELVLLYRS